MLQIIWMAIQNEEMLFCSLISMALDCLPQEVCFGNQLCELIPRGENTGCIALFSEGNIMPQAHIMCGTLMEIIHEGDEL